MVSAAAVAVALVLGVVFAPSPGDSFVTKPPPSDCPVDKFDCRNGKCISGSRWCDGIDNCGNNADELTCRVCLSGSLKCKASNQCVPQGSRCNGKTECQDGSDEMGCENLMTEISTAVSSADTAPTSGASNAILSATVYITSLICLFY